MTEVDEDGTAVVRINGAAWAQVIEAAAQAELDEMEFMRRALGMYDYICRLGRFEKLLIRNSITGQTWEVVMFPDQPAVTRHHRRRRWWLAWLW